MDSEYPPLPSSKAFNASLQSISLSDGEGNTQVLSGSETPTSMTSGRGQGSSYSSTQVIVHSGDLILQYTSLKHAETTHTRWRVSSESLMQSSPYFRALLDPDKFSEGRNLVKQRELHKLDVNTTVSGDVAGFSGNPSSDQDALPTLRLPDDHLPPRFGPDNIGLFLKVLSFNSFTEAERESFEAEVRAQKPSFIAGLIEIADAFNSPETVRECLERACYTLGKPKLPFTKFTASMLKLNENRIRQSIFIAKFLNHQTVFKMLTHALVVGGSRFWVNGIEPPAPDSPGWHYLSDGLEEELYYRRQSVLNTVTDLQAHFLRIYGALGEPTPPSKPGTLPLPNPSPASRQYQCRCGLGNSSACDIFHLGQMTRFFSLRTKTIFIGSTLLDPDFNPDIENAVIEGEVGTRPTDITSVISLLKQCPDYQIDSNHMACGIRRRFLPALDCIEGFVGDERGLLGVNLSYWRKEGNDERRGGESNWPHFQGSWANRAHRRALLVEIRLSRIMGIPLMSPGSSAAEYREEDARLLFTAKKRNWEA
ncbi:hypothetical protein AN0920.2 [Aspergillus nidulans FGSC A4]|uniref:BTB domain-containing protein n=1 Tax=Emericella nidulans (strain FGSC A4 / ATCC 38163 / CBS 112.46 / NRRL 194 / M139) TaxID=227321 RepID=Q5BEW0_EMENI|nr:hypothetical protein [Aspergillus nidulans FGSC A4]EAA65949.1 hypothetical protein AN0920.2 [Aspergillus nidulans FGSC A4]CBF88523.1 TPA: conserved hypothetical protein [Aspergillus nidulans FGSC A4]|eukprot:XP_658524.1 hypothetical protein AN0920.2 [Aspergillus nidulans FGSC A4]